MYDWPVVITFSAELKVKALLSAYYYTKYFLKSKFFLRLKVITLQKPLFALEYAQVLQKKSEA